MIGIDINVDGLKEIEVKFTNIPKTASKGVRKEINAGIKSIHADIIKSLDSISHGRTYIKKGGKVHVASKPGDAPNNDTGNLKRQIRMYTGREMVTKGYSASVRTRAPYSQVLENGTKKTDNLKPRPFMEPALKKNIKTIRDNIEKAVAGSVRKFLK